MIEISNVTKRYYSLRALNNISLTIPQGEVVGLLGPNGAGKTTLFKLIAGILHPDAGSISPTGRRWPVIGYKPERLLFPNQMGVGQYLEMVARLHYHQKARVEKEVFESLGQVGMLEAASKKISDCSKGMRQRLGLAQALICDPPLLLLDEPSNGLDPRGQVEIHHIIQTLYAAGKTILLSSHQLEEVTEVCTQLVILNHGEIHYQNRTAEALAAHSQTVIRTDKDLGAARNYFNVLHPDIQVNGDTLILRNEAMALRRQILKKLLETDFDVIHVEQRRTTLAEIYAEAVK